MLQRAFSFALVCVSSIPVLPRLADENARYGILTNRHFSLHSKDPSCTQVALDAESRAEHAGNLASEKGFHSRLKKASEL
ncbi:hypothetical protein Y032_0392g583 [Ancylostoma ceylanicum]|uniref:SCP domain-containing protein n=1 Tax=Ancylostoma ceylanicum TaxID=53326 RepID=A0A016RT14_9BILA|nr:hypothetical protein Y032_0392g583 [Ancylostoma ceylanicum]